MGRSIVQEGKGTCFLCGRNGNGDPLEKHHIFGGANRPLSEADGLFVYLCGSRSHKDGPSSAHRSRETAEYLHKTGQEAWQQHYGKGNLFLKRYGKNYLG